MVIADFQVLPGVLFEGHSFRKNTVALWGSEGGGVCACAALLGSEEKWLFREPSLKHRTPAPPSVPLCVC